MNPLYTNSSLLVSFFKHIVNSHDCISRNADLSHDKLLYLVYTIFWPNNKLTILFQFWSRHLYKCFILCDRHIIEYLDNEFPSLPVSCEIRYIAAFLSSLISELDIQLNQDVGIPICVCLKHKLLVIIWVVKLIQIWG